jgi:hypothetical protein
VVAIAAYALSFSWPVMTCNYMLTAGLDLP